MKTPRESCVQRGRRQGDPLSVVEGLGLLMKKAAEGRGVFAEIRRNKISVSHLQYVEDTIFLGVANIKNARVINRILKNEL